MRECPSIVATVIAAILLFGVPQARALQAASPSALINSLVSDAIFDLKQRNEPDAVRAAKFRGLLEAGFDIPRISRFVLGRFWRTASEEQRQKFTTLFEDWIVRTYSTRFEGYSGQTIRVIGTRRESNVSTVVLSQFVNPNAPEPAKVEWHVRKEADGSYKIVDVSVDGISMALTERDEIAAVADRNGGTAAALDKALEARLNGTTTATN